MTATEKLAVLAGLKGRNWCHSRYGK